jgi:Beta-propeller repeat
MQARMKEAYGKLPLTFEPNQGQTDPRVKFLTRGNGYNLFLSSREAVLVLKRRRPPRARCWETARLAHIQSAPDTKGSTSTVLRMQLVGANLAPRVAGFDQFPGESHYFIGNDRQQWRTHIPHFGKVKYQSVYPGVDLLYYGDQGQLEYDFVVGPGADLRAIKLSFTGARQMHLGTKGELVLGVGDREIRQLKPVIYQQAGGVRKEIAGGYRIEDHSHVSFVVGTYDITRPLVIDPVLLYATYLGGSGDEATVSAVGLAVDEHGNAYVTGNTTSPDFPTTPSAFQSTFAGGPADAFVTKLNRSGSDLVYSTFLGGTDGFDVGFGIAVDDVGNAYVTGPTNSTDFPTTPGAFQSAFAGGFSDTFVTKLNRSGTALVYSTYLGGSSFDPARGIAIDKAGNAYVTGPTGSADFPTTPGAFQPAFAGGNTDDFVTKLNRRGTALVYSTYLGGSGGEFTDVNGIAVDEKGNAYAVGLTDSHDFPITPGAFQAANAGAEDAYVTKLNHSGTGLAYSTYLGGSGFDLNEGIVVGKKGSVYLTGLTASSNFPTTPSAFQPALAGGIDAYVTKLNNQGTALISSSYFGGSGDDFGNGIAMDRAGNAYVTGQTDSLDLPTAPGVFQPANAGSSDAFVARIGHDDERRDDGGHDND